MSGAGGANWGLLKDDHPDVADLIGRMFGQVPTKQPTPQTQQESQGSSSSNDNDDDANLASGKNAKCVVAANIDGHVRTPRLKHTSPPAVPLSSL